MSATTSETDGKPKKAGLFDIRNIIGALLALYGVILALAGLLGEHEPEKTGGVNANLWAGLAMLVFGIAFIAWSRLRPVVVAPSSGSQPGDDIPGDRPPPH
jgi:uncharacterized membrane protein YqjE